MSWYVDKKARQEARPSTKVCYFIVPASLSRLRALPVITTLHRRVFNQIVREAEIAYAISPIVRKHHLTAEETEKFLVELRIPRAANVAGLTNCLVVFQESQLADKLLTEGELRTRGPELMGRIAPLGNASL